MSCASSLWFLPSAQQSPWNRITCRAWWSLWTWANAPEAIESKPWSNWIELPFTRAENFPFFFLSCLNLLEPILLHHLRAKRCNKQTPAPQASKNRRSGVCWEIGQGLMNAWWTRPMHRMSSRTSLGLCVNSCSWKSKPLKGHLLYSNSLVSFCGKGWMEKEETELKIFKSRPRPYLSWDCCYIAGCVILIKLGSSSANLGHPQLSHRFQCDPLGRDNNPIKTAPTVNDT